MQGKNDQNADRAGEDGMPESALEKTEGQLIDLKERVRELARTRQVRDALYAFADKADENSAVRKFREFWDGMPHAVQWAILHVPGTINIHSDLLKLMIQTGLIEYKGAKNDHDIESMNRWEKLKVEWTVRIGSYFIPELKAVAALLPAAMEIKGIRDDVLTDVRYHLRETRQKKDDAKKIAEIRESLAPGGEFRIAA